MSDLGQFGINRATALDQSKDKDTGTTLDVNTFQQGTIVYQRPPKSCFQKSTPFIYFCVYAGAVYLTVHLWNENLDLEEELK